MNRRRAIAVSVVIVAIFVTYLYGLSIPPDEVGAGHVLTVFTIGLVTAVTVRMIGWTR